MSRLVWFCACLSLSNLALVGQLSTSPPVQVTTDTQAYCAKLARVVDAARDAPREVRELSADGQMLCAQGHVQGGLRRLRRAVMLLQEHAAP